MLRCFSLRYYIAAFDDGCYRQPPLIFIAIMRHDMPCRYAMLLMLMPLLLITILAATPATAACRALRLT